MPATDDETASQPPTRSCSRSGKRVLIAVLAVGALVVLIFTFPRMWRSLHGPPFQTIIEPDDDHAVVQFSKVGTAFKSKSFRVIGHFTERQVVVLDSSAVAVPGGRIEFADTTLQPGRFTIRLGQTEFDVMPGGIRVDGQRFEWLRGDLPD